MPDLRHSSLALSHSRLIWRALYGPNLSHAVPRGPTRSHAVPRASHVRRSPPTFDALGVVPFLVSPHYHDGENKANMAASGMYVGMEETRSVPPGPSRPALRSASTALPRVIPRCDAPLHAARASAASHLAALQPQPHAVRAAAVETHSSMQQHSSGCPPAPVTSPPLLGAARQQHRGAEAHPPSGLVWTVFCPPKNHAEKTRARKRRRALLRRLRWRGIIRCDSGHLPPCAVGALQGAAHRAVLRGAGRGRAPAAGGGPARRRPPGGAAPRRPPPAARGPVP